MEAREPTYLSGGRETPTKKTEPIEDASSSATQPVSPRKNEEETLRPLSDNTNNNNVRSPTTKMGEGVLPPHQQQQSPRSNSDQQLAHNLNTFAPTPVKMYRAHHQHQHHQDTPPHDKQHHTQPGVENIDPSSSTTTTPEPMGSESHSVGELFAIFQKCCKERNVKPWPPLVSLFQRCSVEGTNITLYDTYYILIIMPLFFVVIAFCYRRRFSNTNPINYYSITVSI